MSRGTKEWNLEEKKRHKGASEGKKVRDWSLFSTEGGPLYLGGGSLFLSAILGRAIVFFYYIQGRAEICGWDASPSEGYPKQ